MADEVPDPMAGMVRVTDWDRHPGPPGQAVHRHHPRLLLSPPPTAGPRHETYDVLDDNQLTAFLSRETSRLELRQWFGVPGS